MELTYDQKQTYELICDSKGYCVCCYIITTTDVFGDKVYMASTNKTEEIPLEKMKKIIEDPKIEKRHDPLE